MSEALDIAEKIELYLNGGMSNEDVQAFEAAMQEDASLANEVAIVKETEEAILLANLSQMKEMMAGDLKNIKYKPQKNLKKTLLIAGIVLTGAAILTVSLWDNEKPTTSPSTKNTTTESVKKSSTSSISEDLDEDALDTPLASKSSLQQANTTHENPEIIPETKSVDSLADYTPTEEADQTNTDQQDNRQDNETVVTNNEPTCNKGFLIDTKPSCEDKATGIITILTDETIAYAFTVDGKNTSHYKGTFNSMSAGTHQVTITYGENCSYNETVVVEKEWCPQQKSYSFNPDYGETWKPTYEKGTQGSLTIYNHLGKAIFTSKFGSGKEYWDGTDGNGMVSPVGTYQAIMKYDNGNLEKITLTIVR